MRPIAFQFLPLQASASGYLAGATGAGPFTPTSGASGDSLAHLVTIGSTADLSAINFTIIGKAPDGSPQTEVIAGPNNATVTGSDYFFSISSITVSATLGANTANIGWSGESVSHPVVLSYVNETFSVGMGVTVSGTVNYTVQHTFTDLFDRSITYPPNWFDHSFLAGLAISADGNYAYNILATRLKFNSVTSGAVVIWEILQGTGSQ